MHLRDILECIDHIDAFLGRMSLEDYESDYKTQPAIERQLQIMTEAAIRLGEDAEILCPGLNWNGIRGMGNFLRHEYHRVDNKIVWNTVKEELPRLRAAVDRALA
jgi:uncharacterized protein with HEPN domain